MTKLMQAIQNSVGLGYELTFKKMPYHIVIELKKNAGKHIVQESMLSDEDINESELALKIHLMNCKLSKLKK